MTTTPKRTPLHDRHVALGARMVEFAGWSMPVQYRGLIEEHQAVRTAAGLFDVSHMGELTFRGDGAEAALQHLVPGDVAKLADGHAMYTVLLRPTGGIVDDVIIYRLAADDYLVVVNASNRQKDYDWCRDHLTGGATLRDESDAWALLALQGPRAQAILAPLTNIDLAALASFRLAQGDVAGARAIVSRTGYTGEDGFEIFCASAAAVPVWDALLAAGSVGPSGPSSSGKAHGIQAVGLGARDSLRTEMKYSLYGNDIDDTTTPLEAGLGWLVKLDKGDFIGKDVLVAQKEHGVPRKLVGLEMIDPGIPRHGYLLVEGGRQIGIVTSGTHSPTLGRPIGIGYVPPEKSAAGTELSVDIRGKPRRARVVKTPFYRRPTERKE